ncbi:MAG TPA: efflux RND transporter permease subunit [Pyrinomonadaceae bacterium]
MQKLAEICVRRPVFATMLILSLTVVGLFSFNSLGVDLFPKIDLPTITVTVINPGASPREIETEITDKVEAAVNTISGIDELRSTSVEGVSQVFITFILDKNADVAAQEVRDKVGLVVPDLPETAETPTVQKLDTDAAPVLRIAVSAPRSLRDVTDIADKQIKKRIESINGVGNVGIVGGSRREIQVMLDPDKMRAFNITVPEVIAAVRAQNMEVPGGRVDEGTRELTVRTLGRITDPASFNELVVATRGDYSVKVKDIGYVEDGAEEPRTEARLNGQPAVTLVVSKQSGQNTVAVADEVKARLAEIQPALPPGFKAEVVGDQSVFIKASLDAIETHLIEGGILAAIVVFIFLWNFRSTIIAALAIPTSIISAFALIAALGYSLNQMTMPTIRVSASIVMLLSVKSINSMRPNVAMIEVGIAMAAMKVERKLHRKMKTTMAARMPPSMRCVSIALSDALMKTDWSPTTSALNPGGSVGSISRKRSLTASATATVFCPDCFETTSVTAGCPFKRASVRGSSAPSST